MQNAIIKYKIRLDKEPLIGKEIEVNIKLSEFESDWTITDALEEQEGIDIGGWANQSYTVIERTIELFNED